MKAPLDVFKVLKVEPTNDLQTIKQAYYARSYETHMQELDSQNANLADDIQQIKLAYETVDSQEKLELYRAKHSLNNFLQSKREYTGFFKNKINREVRGYLSVPFTEQSSDNVYSDVVSLPKLGKQEKPKVDLNHFVYVLNNLSAETTLPIGLTKEEIIKINNEHKFTYPQLLVRVSFPKNLLSSSRLSEGDLVDATGQVWFNASSLPCLWTLIGCDFSQSDILEIFPMSMEDYKNAYKFNFERSSSLWPLDYHYEALEIQSSLVP